MEELELRGEWWHPYINEEGKYDQPDKVERVAGELSYTPTRGASLDLIGSLSDAPPESLEEIERGTLHGRTTDGKFVTLVDTFPTNRSMSMAQVQVETESYHVSRVLVGGLLDETTEYWKMSFSTQCLEEWTNQPIEDSPGKTRLPEGPGEVRSIELDDIDITLGMWEDIEGLMPSIPGRANFSIWPNSPMTIAEFLDEYFVPLRNFLTLAMGEVSFPRDITLYTGKYGRIETDVELYFAVNDFREQEEIPSIRMNYTLQDIDLEVSLRNWFTSFRECPRLHYMFFGTEVKADMYEDMRFMYYVFGLEAYHRQYFDGYYMDNEEYHTIRDEVIKQIPDVEAKSRMTNVLQSLGNEYSVKDRLVDIFEHHENILRPMFDLEDTASTARDIRHNIAHTVGDRYDNDELRGTSEKLQAAAGACLIENLTLEEPTKEQTLRDNYNEVFVED